MRIAAIRSPIQYDGFRGTARCQSERAVYQRFLLRLCEREVHDRELRAAERRVKTAKFPVVKTLDTFNFQDHAGSLQSP